MRSFEFYISSSYRFSLASQGSEKRFRTSLRSKKITIATPLTYEGFISSHLRDHPNEIENFRGNIKRLTQSFDTLEQFVLNCFRYLRNSYRKTLDIFPRTGVSTNEYYARSYDVAATPFCGDSCVRPVSNGLTRVITLRTTERIVFSFGRVVSRLSRERKKWRKKRSGLTSTKFYHRPFVLGHIA